MYSRSFGSVISDRRGSFSVVMKEHYVRLQ
jgi:hypothetical protein